MNGLLGLVLVVDVTVSLSLVESEEATGVGKKFPCWSMPVKPFLLTSPCYPRAGGDVLCRCNNITLDCSSNFGRLTYVPKVFPGVQVLNFSNNELQRLDSDRFFLNVSRSVRLLDLYNNDMAVLTPNAFHCLQKLRSVLIGGNNLSYQDLRVVFSIPSLKEVDIKCGNLGIIPVDYFSTTASANLEHLDLSWNSITTLNMRVFQPLRKLRSFALWRNQLSSLLTAYLPSLESLSLRGNRLFDFPATCKRGSASESLFPNLKQLVLTANSISTIVGPVCLPRLADLQLAYNRIEHFIPDLFSAVRFPALRVLSVVQMESKIKQIRAYTFNNSGLRSLFLGYTYLDFSSSAVSHDMLAGCSGLTFLYLRQNNFRKVSKERLHRFLGPVPHLEVLYMPQNQIQTIRSDTFTRLPRLRRLYLFENWLVSLPDGAFDSLPMLQHLSLGGNHIGTMPSEAFSAETRQRLRVLDLSGNPLRCGCDALWLQQWMRERPGLFENYQQEGYWCANLHNTTVQDFFISPQACIWSTSVYIIIISFICLFILVFIVSVVIFGYRWHIKLWLYTLCRGRYAERGRRQADTGEWRLRFRYDVFLGYAEEDVEWVQGELLPMLEDAWQLRVCLHQRDFLPGKHIMDNISDSTEESRRFVMVFSPHFARSPWCQFELRLCQTVAMDREDVLLLLLLPGTRWRDMSASMLALLHTTTCLEWPVRPDLAGARQSFWGRLALAIGRQP